MGLSPTNNAHYGDSFAESTDFTRRAREIDQAEKNEAFSARNNYPRAHAGRHEAAVYTHAHRVGPGGGRTASAGTMALPPRMERRRQLRLQCVAACQNATHGENKVTLARNGMTVWGNIAQGIVIRATSASGDQFSAAMLSLAFSTATGHRRSGLI